MVKNTFNTIISMKKNTQPVGRPRKFDETEILQKVMKLFWNNGYEGTGMSDIIATTGLAKGSLYKAFGNKKNLYLQAMNLYEQQYVDTASNALTDNQDPIKRIKEFLSSPIKASNLVGENNGCFLCNASADRADLDPEIRTLVQRGFNKLGQALQLAISELNPETATDQVNKQAEALLALYSGLHVMSRSGLEKKRMEAARDGGLLGLGIKIS